MRRTEIIEQLVILPLCVALCITALIAPIVTATYVLHSLGLITS